MKTIKLKKNAFAMALIATTSINSMAQEIENEVRKTKISVEIDPVTFGFNGYSFHLRVQPKNCEHLLIGFGLYAMDMPEVFVDFNPTNKGKGWESRINKGFGLFAEHHFKEVNQKWFVGAQASLQEFKIENISIQGNAKHTNGLVMAYGGYSFQPFNFNLYIKPWAGIGYTSKLSGKNTLGGSEYDISPITMFATLHIGYTF